ncbi:MAG: deoxynucleoside kinase [Leadbetterella sp.]
MHIAIAGNIGVGKTTLAQMLSQHYGWEIEYESVDENPYLAPFYDDMHRWAFHLQIFFLNSRFRQALKIQSQTEKVIVQDRSIYEDAYIFAQNLLDSNLISKTDFETYSSIFHTINKTIQAPDIMIYLKADLDKLKKQIKIRNRAYEQNMDFTYLEDLNKLYEKFTQNYVYGKFIEIDVNEMDFVNNKKDFMKILYIIENELNIGAQLKI